MTNDPGTLDERFFEWVATEVDIYRTSNPARSYWLLLEEMYKTPFRPVLTRDVNRIEDGLRLRLDWARRYGEGDNTDMWLTLEVSVLEVLVALAQHLSFKTGMTTGEWFWEVLDNLDLRSFSDAEYLDGGGEQVTVILERFVSRRYSEEGLGGPFPLKHARSDQRGVEIWYQMNAYLSEDMDRFF